MNHTASSRDRVNKQILLTLAISLSAIGFIVVPAWQLLTFGPFSWHIAQPAYVQGGTEAIALIVLLALAQLIATPRLRLAIVVVSAEFFLRRHGVDLAIAVDILYFELCIGLGAFAIRLINNVPPASVLAYIESFLIGFCIWSVLAWTLSALGHGSPGDLRWLTLLLSLPALYGRSRPWIVFAYQRITAMPRNGRVCAAVLLAWILIQVARTSVAIDFDGMWYGLRGEYVLAGQGSAFVSSGLVSPVYYFPKIYELFLLPVTGLGSSTAITGITIMMSVLLVGALYEALRRMGVQDQAVRLVCVATCLTLPAVANQMLVPKGDIFSALLLVLAWLKSSDLMTKRDRKSLVWFVGLLMLAPQARLIAIPYAAALAIATLAVCFFWPRTQEPSKAGDSTVAWFAFALIVIVTIFATLRTLLLAGMPTVGPEPLVKLWRFFGFNFKYPVGTLQWSFSRDWADTLPLIVDYLFRPQRLLHVVITWVGNVWLWLAMVATCGALLSREEFEFDRTRTLPPAVLATVGFTLMLCWGYHDRGGDGNYFIAGLLAAILLGSAATWCTIQKLSIARRVWLASLIAFCLAQAAYSFMSAAWTTGTRPFDLSFGRGVHSLREKQRAIINGNGIAQIANYLRRHDPAAHVVGYVDYEPGFCLPAVFEHLADISFSSPQLVENRANFLKFITDTHVQFLIVPTKQHAAKSIASQYVSPMIASFAEELSKDQRNPVIHDVDYEMYDLSNVIHGRMLNERSGGSETSSVR